MEMVANTFNASGGLISLAFGDPDPHKSGGKFDKLGGGQSKLQFSGSDLRLTYH
jgi:hypothetical protein